MAEHSTAGTTVRDVLILPAPLAFANDVFRFHALLLSLR